MVDEVARKRRITLSADQQLAFDFLNEQKEPVMLIKALAGTGKSTIATLIVEACYETGAARDEKEAVVILGAESAAAGRTRAGRALHLPGRLVHGRFVHQKVMVGAQVRSRTARHVGSAGVGEGRRDSRRSDRESEGPRA